MLSEKLKRTISNYPDFPKKGILFRDINPVLADAELLNELIEKIASNSLLPLTDAIVAIDARGFIFASIIAYKLKKPLILARKKNKLPGSLKEIEYALEYGKDCLSIQKASLIGLEKFIIVDDLLATGGTAKCVGDILLSQNKKVLSLLVIIELSALKGREKLSFPVFSEVQY
jgi:adenine phosphoribosyltransferase